jgi:signal transduction histidine kinase
MSFWQTLTGRLFKLVFGWYLILAIAVTSVQLMLEYSSINDDIAANLKSLGHSFAPSVADALWAIDRPQLEAMATGIVRATYVTGADIESERGDIVAKAGEVPTTSGDPAQGLFAPYQFERFPLVIRSPRGEQMHVGHLVLYSNRGVVIDRVRYSFFVIVINSLVKTAGLWLIFFLVITRSLARPLAALTGVVSRIEFAASGGEPASMEYPHEDELGRLLQATDKMQERVAASQQLVAERTRELLVALDAAESANRLKSALLANVSHELRTPLNLVLGYTQILSMSSELSEEQRKYVNEIGCSGHHLLDLINDMIEVSRIEARAIAVVPVAFDLREFLLGVQTSSEALAFDKGLQVRMTMSADLPQVVIGDAGKLRQSLLNLLSALVKRSNGGQIEFSASAEVTAQGTLLVSCVHSSSTDMSADEIESIFQPFVHTRLGGLGSEGSGLELVLSREYALLLGGTLTAERDPEGGIRTRLTVPIKLAECSADGG